MRVFKTKWFSRYVRHEAIKDSKLAKAVREIESGLYDADYGGGLVKKRVAREGGGKSGGYRSVVAYKEGKRCVFMFCFAKSSKDNLDNGEVVALKDAAKIYLGLSDTEIATALFEKEIEEVEYNEEEV